MSEVRILRAALDPKREIREIAREVALRIGRGVRSVASMIHRLHAVTGYTSPSPFRPWTPEEIATLDAAIPSSSRLPPGSIHRLARSLGRSREAIRQALYRRRVARGMVKRRKWRAK